jgi:hypothetical protein
VFSAQRSRHPEIDIPQLALSVGRECHVIDLPSANWMRNGNIDLGAPRRVIYSGMKVAARFKKLRLE